MPPKSYQSRKKGNNNSGHEVLGVILIIISAFTLLCIIIPPFLSIISRGIFNIITGALGVFAYPFFLCIFIWGFMLLGNKSITVSKKSVALIVITSIIFMMILQIAFTYNLLNQSISAYISNVYSQKFTPGGVVFGIISYGLTSAITPVASLVLLSLVFVCLLAVMGNVIEHIRNYNLKRRGGVNSHKGANPNTMKFIKTDNQAHMVKPVADNSLYVGTIQKRPTPSAKFETGSTKQMPPKIVRPISGFTDTPIFESYSSPDYSRTQVNPPQTENNDSKVKHNAQKILFEDKQTMLMRSLEQYQANSEKVSYTPAVAATAAVSAEPQIIDNTQPLKKPKAIVHENALQSLAFPEPKDFEHEYVDGPILNGDDITRNLMEQQQKTSRIHNQQTYQNPALQPVQKQNFDDEFDIHSGFDTRKINPASLTPVEDFQIGQDDITNGDYFKDSVVSTAEQRFERMIEQEKHPLAQEACLEPNYNFDNEDNISNNNFTDNSDNIQDEQNDLGIIKASEFVPDFKAEAFAAPETAFKGGEDIQTDTVFNINETVLDLSENNNVVKGEDFSGRYVPVKKSSSKIPQNQITIDNYLEKRAEEIAPAVKRKRNKSSKYVRPSIDMLLTYSNEDDNYNSDYEKNSRIIEQTLENLKIPAKVTAVTRGPSVTRYELEMPPGIPVKRVDSFARDLEYNLASRGKIRIEAPIPGKRAVGVEVPNDKVSIVGLRDIIGSKEFQNASSPLTLALGKDIGGANITCALEKMPHLLIAGSTGSGKSACLNSIIISILFKSTPDEVRLILIDPKRVEFIIYRDMPHLLFKDIINDTDQAINTFKWAKKEMDRRYLLFSQYCARNISDFNNCSAVKEGAEERLPNIVIIVDELCELMLSSNKRDLEEKIMSMAQKARAAGIHLILATQRPSVDVITGTIKANLSSRIAFAVTSIADSRTILDSGGAEALIGRGDMLFSPIDANEPKRIQGAFVDNEEVAAIVGFVKDNNECNFDEEAQKGIFVKAPEPSENSSVSGTEEMGFDPLVPEVLRRIMECGQATTSMIQRRFPIGYARASRIIDQLELNKFIGPLEGNNKPREVYITKEIFKEVFGEDF